MRHLLVVTLTATFAVTACSSGGSPGTTGKAGTGGNAVGNAGQTGSAGAGAAGTGVAGASGGTTGAAGTGAAGTTTGSGGGGATGAAGANGGATGAAGATSNPDAGLEPDGGGGDFPTAACAPGAIFCDDFEQYLIQGAFNGNVLRDFIKMGETTPTWLGYHLHGPPYVVAAAVFGGKQVYQLDTEGGHPVAADIIKEAPDGVDLWPAKHYGRFMVNLKGLPATGTFGIMTESGLLPGSTTNMAQYTLGGVDGKLSFMYAQRVRPVKNDVSDPNHRVGGNWGPTTSPASQAPTTLCTVAATSETIPVNKWVCVEWMVDRTKSELHMWLDGVAQTQVDVTGAAGTCSAGTAPTWTGPAHFTELDLGWEITGSDAGGRGAQFDMFAIGTQKLGCPAP